MYVCHHACGQPACFLFSALNHESNVFQTHVFNVLQNVPTGRGSKHLNSYCTLTTASADSSMVKARVVISLSYFLEMEGPLGTAVQLPTNMLISTLGFLQLKHTLLFIHHWCLNLPSWVKSACLCFSVNFFHSVFFLYLV